MTYKKLPTNKLFYGRWPYKVETMNSDVSVIRRLARHSIHPSLHERYNTNYHIKLWDMLVRVPQIPNIKVRHEGPHVNFFTDSLDVLEEICTTMGELVTAVHAPLTESDLSTLTQNKRLVVVTALPHKTFTHRVTLKWNTPTPVRDSLMKWIENMPADSVKLTPRFKEFLYKSYAYANPFFYIKDEKATSMLALMVGNHIHAIEKFVLSSSINTES